MNQVATDVGMVEAMDYSQVLYGKEVSLKKCS